MALSLRDVERDPVAKRALKELLHRYTLTEEKSRLVLAAKFGNMRLYFHTLDDLHQWDFDQQARMRENTRSTTDSRKPQPPPKPHSSPQQRIEELEAQVNRLRASGRKIIDQREEWKRRALSAEAKLGEANNGQNGGGADRYSALKRYLAKQYHPDRAPGQGIERMARSEIFKEIWGEIERLDQT
jgi:hypothetical protein